MNQSLRFITEMGPLLLFFAAYHSKGLLYATAVLIIATIIAVAVTFYYEKKIPWLPFISAIILGIFGGLTLISQDDIFIKMKPTLVNALFASILLGGYLRKRGLLKYLFGSALEMKEEAWLSFSFRWGLFFIFLALVNEVIWRNFSTDFWVSFKVFGMLPLTICFMISQIPFLKKNMIEQ